MCFSLTFSISKRKTDLVKCPSHLLEYLLKTKIHIQLVRQGCVPFSLKSTNDTPILAVFHLFATPIPCITLILPNPNSFGCNALL